MRLKRIVIAAFTILLIVLCTIRVAPQAIEPRSYLPLVYQDHCYEEPGMSDWQIIVPEETTNEIINPSFEVNVTDGWTDNGMVTFQRSTVRARFGVASIHLVANAITDNAQSDAVANADAGETWTASCWVWVVAGDFQLRVEENAGGWTAQATISTATTGEWVFLEVTTTLDGGVTDARLRLRPNATAASEFYVDAVQFEEKSAATTYCDGNQEGCEWNGAAHNSTSTRSAQSRAGGVVTDLKTVYGFGVDNFMATGMPPQSTEIDNYALLPGGELNDIKIQPREFTLMGTLAPSKIPDCTKSLDDLRAALEKELAHDRYPKDGDNWQPIILRYTGDGVDKEIEVHYAGGLEGRIAVDNVVHEKIPIRFSAPDPLWYEIGESAQILDTEDTPTLRYMTGRLRSTGQWDDLGLTANPTVAGEILTIAVGPDGNVYVGGAFTGMDGAVGRDNLAMYTPSTDTWSTVGPASSVNGKVHALIFGPDGTLYIGGEFTNLGGATGDYVSTWTGAAFSPVSGGGTADVYALAIGLDGTLYIGGDFVTWNGLGNGNRIVSWNGVAYAVLGTGGDDNLVFDLVVGLDGTLYAAGNFTGMGGVANTPGVAAWDGSAWSALSTGANSSVWALAIGADGTLYLGGAFTTLGGISVIRIGKWNGTAFFPLSTGMTGGDVFDIEIGPDGMLYASGDFTVAGGITIADHIARWNGSSWAHLDIDFPGAAVSQALAIGEADPVILSNYDIWVGFTTTGASEIAGTTTVTNDGTAHVFPKFVTNRSGGTSAILETLRNETLGRELLFDYALLDEETLTLDNRPDVQTIISSFFGSRLDATLAGDDFGDWSLQPGDNQVTCFVNVAGAPTIVGYLLYKDAYKGHSD